MANRTTIPRSVSDGESAAAARIEKARRLSSRKLKLSGLQLAQVPEAIVALTQLRELDLSNNQVKAIPESIRAFKQLQTLDLYVNGLTDLPDWVGEFSDLRILRVSGNSLNRLPESLRQLRQLRILDLDVNRLTELPEWIGELKNLEELYVAGNRFASLPESIGELDGLQMLSLSYNLLTSLPEAIGRLQKLETITAARNQLTSLPVSLKELPLLSELYLHENPQLSLPAELLGPSWQDVADGKGRPTSPAALLEYYFRISPGNARPLNEAKLIVVGRGQVGKTSLVDRLVHNRFSPDQQKTDGIEITEWMVGVKEEDVRLNIWDFGGQEIMHATHQFFLTERALYILVLNGREGGEDADVQYWLKLIESFGGDSPVIVVCNKIRSQPFDLNRRGLHDKYPGRIRDFIRTDCQDASGIAELRNSILREVADLPHLHDLFPASWLSIKNRLAGMKESYISFVRYRELCNDLGETSDKAQETLAVALHCLGVALNYKDDPRLSDTHVLNPHWVTNGVYKILNSALVENNRGELARGDLSQILDETAYPPTMHEFLLGLMRKFELCFRFPEPRDEVFLIPQLLGKEQPSLGTEFEPAKCLLFQYTYPVWPEGVLARFIVRTHALSAHQHRWRTGVILEFEGNRALVRADPEEKTIVIAVAGPLHGRRRLLAIIRSDFERIHADVSKLNPIASVPVAEDISVSIPYQELQVYEANGVTSVPRVIGGRLVTLNVADLLNSVELPRAAGGEPVKIFVSYSHRDDELRAELESHLKLFQRLGLIRAWHDRLITPGEEWKGEIDRNMADADLILMLISPDFLGSDYCYETEMPRALEKHRSGQAVVVPIIVRSCQWQRTPLADLQVLPRDGRPIRLWRNRDSAWSDVAEKLGSIIVGFRKSRDLG